MGLEIDLVKNGSKISGLKGEKNEDHYILKQKGYESVLAFLSVHNSEDTMVHHKSHHDKTVSEAINFVHLRMDQEKTPHRLFNALGHKLGPFYEKISLAAANHPLIGILPALFCSLIGCIQMVLATIFSIVGILFLWSNNGKIFEERMIRHIGHGFCNIICGIALVFPVIGKKIYYATHPEIAAKLAS